MFGGELTCGGRSTAVAAAIRGDGDGNAEDQRVRVAKVKRGGGGLWNPCHEELPDARGCRRDGATETCGGRWRRSASSHRRDDGQRRYSASSVLTSSR